jgi:hypothetical protein
MKINIMPSSCQIPSTVFKSNISLLYEKLPLKTEHANLISFSKLVPSLLHASLSCVYLTLETFCF